MAQFLATQFELQTASWKDLRATTLSTLEDEGIKSSTDISLAYVLKRASEQPAPAQETHHGKTGRKK